MNGTNNLFIGGSWKAANNIASWDGNSWSILGINSTNNGVVAGSNSVVHALAMNGTNQLLVGGYFTSIDGGSILANNIASWNGNSWHSFGIGSNAQISAIVVNFSNFFFLGGDFTLHLMDFVHPIWFKVFFGKQKFLFCYIFLFFFVILFIIFLEAFVPNPPTPNPTPNPTTKSSPTPKSIQQLNQQHQ